MRAIEKTTISTLDDEAESTALSTIDVFTSNYGVRGSPALAAVLPPKKIPEKSLREGKRAGEDR